MPNYSREQAVQLGASWRKAAEEAPVLDLTKKPRDRVIDKHCIRNVPSTGWQAVATRDYGFHKGGHMKERAAERAFHLKLFCSDPATRQHAAMDHDAAGFLAEGFFGDKLPFVLVQKQAEDKTVTANPDTWHYLLFVNEAWEDPICGLRPEGFQTWLQHTLSLRQPAKDGAA